MLAFSKSLDGVLHRALDDAIKRNHEYATLEHLLLALIDDRDAAAILHSSNVDLAQLRMRLISHLNNELNALVVKGNTDATPTTGFQRVINRALVRVQSSSDSEEVTGANVLVALSAERESHAAFFLHEHGMIW